MASAKIDVHHRYVPTFGPASKFVPPTMQIQEQADPGGGQPTEPSALVFVDPDDGETQVFVMSDKTRRLLVQMLTGGVIVAGSEPT